MLRASYILEQEQGDKTAPLSRRPKSHPKCNKLSETIAFLFYQFHSFTAGELPMNGPNPGLNFFAMSTEAVNSNNCTKKKTIILKNSLQSCILSYIIQGAVT